MTDLQTTVTKIHSIKGEHIKRLLFKSEKIQKKLDDGEIDANEYRFQMRKAILDEMNNYTRAIQNYLGYKLEM